MIKLALLSFVLLGLFPSGELLSAVKVASLPRKTISHTSVFDGKSTITLIGGSDVWGNYFDDILQFNTVTHEFTNAGKFPQYSYMASGVQLSNGEILLAGGYDHNEDGPNAPFGLPFMWRINEGITDITNVTFLNDHAVDSAVVEYSSHAYLFGGVAYHEQEQITNIHRNRFKTIVNTRTRMITEGGGATQAISKFNTGTNTIEVVAQLPTAMYSTAAARFGDLIYTFGGHHGIYYPVVDYIFKITTFDPLTNKVEDLDVEFEYGIQSAQAVATPESIYIIGGERRLASIPKHSMSRFDPVKQTVEHIEVDNFVAGIYDHQAVYVPSTNGIYVFGGYDEQIFEPLIDVFYIQL